MGCGGWQRCTLSPSLSLFLSRSLSPSLRPSPSLSHHSSPSLFVSARHSRITVGNTHIPVRTGCCPIRAALLCVAPSLCLTVVPLVWVVRVGRCHQRPKRCGIPVLRVCMCSGKHSGAMVGDQSVSRTHMYTGSTCMCAHYTSDAEDVWLR